jgi:hypothetical protein
MKQRLGYFFAAAAAVFLMSGAARAQITPAEGYTPVDDTPVVKVGGTIFADYTYQQEPQAVDADGNTYHPNAFNITRAYINVTGQISHLISFRITPDVVRTGSVTIPGGGGNVDVPGLTGTLTYRLKYAYGQLNFDDFTTKGSWFRLGMQQTPYIDFEENIYRYRFSGTVFVDREGFLSSSDLGASVHWNFPGNFGDIHTGVYNGEGYTRAEVNDQKAFMIRGTLRPLPMIPALRGLRLTGFYDGDHYVRDAKRERFVGFLSYESPYFNFGAQYVKAKDQTSVNNARLEAEGYSVWATPRLPCGIEALIRWDRISPNRDLAPRRQRLIAGPAYWFPVTKSGIAAALILQFEQLRYMGAPNSRPTEERYGLFTLFNF